MKTTKKKSSKNLKPIGAFLAAFLVGWLITYPIRSFADGGVAEAGFGGFWMIVSTLLNIVVVVGVLAGILHFGKQKKHILEVIAKWFGAAKRLITSRRRQELPAIENMPMVLVASPATVTANNKLTEAKEKLLKKHVRFGTSYKIITDGDDKAQSSSMSKRDKERSANLRVLAQTVLENLVIIESLGQINTQEIIGLGGSQVYGEKTHKEKAEAKIKEIELAMFVLMSEHATKISNDIDDIKIPDSYDLEDRLEAVRFEGERLIGVLEGGDTSVSTESEFVLKKVVNERIDELWEGYKQAKESFFEKEVGIFDLGAKNKVNPDLVIKEALTDIEAIFKEVDISIKTSRENKAIDSLMVTKKYFNNR